MHVVLRNIYVCMYYVCTYRVRSTCSYLTCSVHQQYSYILHRRIKQGVEVHVHVFYTSSTQCLEKTMAFIFRIDRRNVFRDQNHIYPFLDDLVAPWLEK